MTGPAQRGTTDIADKAVRRIAERAAEEALPVPASGTGRTSVAVHGRRAAVALRVALPYPAALSDTARRVQRHVAARTGELTGLDIRAARLTVTRLALSSARTPPVAQAEEMPDARRPPRRWWSQRRVPMTVVILPVAAACAAVTADVIRVHATGQGAAAWRMSVVSWLAGHGPGDTSVVVAGAVVALLGVWLIVLALTPGRRQQMPLSVTSREWNAAVDRATVATFVRDAVGDVPGMGAVDVRARRRRVRVRARLAFGDRDQAREQATAIARQALAACGLGRTPRLKLTVTPEPTWQPPASGTPASETPISGTPISETPADLQLTGEVTAGGER
ncbi:hypothetical protein CG723_40730 [Streptomyces sp. CB01635]|uniref:DUF6286 domain-containing Asp23/Gls24 family envelope stress response protein n=1 Tax=unclassified Streptomyces TaxID=2593676 RepID=UPI000C2703DD|nr:DUF6286 domain-containing protein [Streptomyces sp. CB01635]PJN06194.1 hypothetical protein CG723_40730 [Streptomyces sp. CB01635]